MATQVVRLSCPSCGGKLELTPDIERFACLYCGKEHLVQRGGGIVSLGPVVEKIEQVQKAVEQGSQFSERTADELLLQRIEKERKEAEAAFQNEWRRLNELRASAGNNQFFAFIAIAICIVISSLTALIGLASVVQAFQGTSSLGGALGSAIVNIFIAVAVLGFGIVLGWALLTASRRQFKDVESQRQMINNRIEKLQTQETEVRKRLKA